MKKVGILLWMCLAVALSSHAQDKAIGLKIGNGLSVSGQMKLGGDHRVEANIGQLAGFGSFGVSGYYQVCKPLDQLFSGCKWFYGIGADVYSASDLNLGVGGQVGLEYVFPEIPLQLTLDLVPTINILGGFGLQGHGGVGVRYVF